MDKKKIFFLKEEMTNLYITNEFLLVHESFNTMCGDELYLYNFTDVYKIKSKGCVLFQSSSQILNNFLKKKTSLEEKITFIYSAIKDINNIFFHNYDTISLKEFFIYKGLSNPKRFDCVLFPWKSSLVFFAGVAESSIRDGFKPR